MTVPDLTAIADLRTRFSGDVEEAGLVGERLNAILVLLCAVSAKLARPLHLTVQAASAAGKNYLLSAVAAFLPPGWAKIITGMSPKALMHSAEDEFEHRPIFIAEYEGVAGADYAIRTFQSEQVIEWEFVDCSKGIKKKTNRVRGPAAFIQATTRPVLHPENETRLLFTHMDESPEQTQAILRQQAREAAMGTLPPPKQLFEPWQKLISDLKAARVLIPFAPKLALHFPTKLVRSRRDFPKLLGLIEVSAFLHQYTRETKGTCVIAEPKDYVIAKELFEHCYSAMPDKSISELVNEAMKLQMARDDFSATELVRSLGWGKSKVYQVMGRAEELGCLAKVEGWGRYVFLRSHINEAIALPDDF